MVLANDLVFSTGLGIASLSSRVDLYSFCFRRLHELCYLSQSQAIALFVPLVLLQLLQYFLLFISNF